MIMHEVSFERNVCVCVAVSRLLSGDGPKYIQSLFLDF